MASDYMSQENMRWEVSGEAIIRHRLDPNLERQPGLGRPCRQAARCDGCSACAVALRLQTPPTHPQPSSYFPSSICSVSGTHPYYVPRVQTHITLRSWCFSFNRSATLLSALSNTHTPLEKSWASASLLPQFPYLKRCNRMPPGHDLVLGRLV